ncbi:MAG: complex I subunit 1 family protein [Thermodesulfobacteriota bacterium]
MDGRRILLVAGAVVLPPIIGALLTGLDRKLTARIQGRIGPPVLQPFYDVGKLFRKEAVVLNRVKTLYVWMHLAFMVMVMVLLVMGQDMLMALFAHAFSSIALILGAMSVRSPYSRLGAQRKIMQMLAYEPVLVLMVVGMSLDSWSFMAGDLLTRGRPLLLSLPLVFIGYFMAAVIKLDKSPFDVATAHHAHQELVKGVTLEFAGPYLALIEITHFYEVFLVFTILFVFGAASPILGIGLAVAGFLGVILVDNASARLTTRRMVRFMWTAPLLMAVLNLAWFYF